MAFWRFLDYVTEGHENPVSDWYGTLDPSAKAEFDVLVGVLSETENWDEPKPSKRKYKVLTRRHVGLCELKFRLQDGRKFRPIGILDWSSREFIFLGGCEKKGFFGATNPPNAFDDALRLKRAYDEGKGAIRDHT